MKDEFDVELEPAAKPLAKMPELPDDRPAPPLDEYVALQVAITKAQISEGRLGTQAVDDPLGRLARTEKYAKWRWHGYKAGHIENL